MKTYKLMNAACNTARFLQMGLYADGPYTRIQFYYFKGYLTMECGRLDDKGSLVQTLTSAV